MHEQMYMPGGEPEPAKRKGCSWVVIIPLGCLGLAICIAGVLGLVLLRATRAVKSSELYTEALAQVQASPEVAEALGSPIEGGMPRSASFHMDGTSGDAEAVIPIAGPKGSGTLYAAAEKIGTKWKFTTLEVIIEASGETIHLLPEEPARSVDLSRPEKRA
jgi:hypothetical protein